MEANSNAVSQPGRARKLGHKSIILSVIGVIIGVLTIISVLAYYVSVASSHPTSAVSSSSSSHSDNFTALTNATRPAVVTVTVTDPASAATATFPV